MVKLFDSFDEASAYLKRQSVQGRKYLLRRSKENSNKWEVLPSRPATGSVKEKPKPTDLPALVERPSQAQAFQNPAKKISVIDLAVIAANLGNNIHGIDEVLNDPLVQRAIEMTTNRPLEELINDQDALEGAISTAKGKYFELLVEERLNAGEAVGDLTLPSNFQAHIAENMNQPGWDIAITDEHGQVVDTIQLKATDSTSYIQEALENYPDIKILSTSEVANIDHGSGVVLDSGISVTEVERVVGHAIDGQGADFAQNFIDSFNPLLPLIFILGTEGYKLFVGKQSVEQALDNIQGRGVRAATGGAVGAVCYALGLGWLSVIPAVLAARAGPDGVIEYIEGMASAMRACYNDWTKSWKSELPARLTQYLAELNLELHGYGLPRLSMEEFLAYLKREGFNPTIPIIDDARLGWLMAGYPPLCEAREKALVDEAIRDLEDYLKSK